MTHGCGSARFQGRDGHILRGGEDTTHPVHQVLLSSRYGMTIEEERIPEAEEALLSFIKRALYLAFILSTISRVSPIGPEK